MCDCWFKVVPVELVICVGIVETCRSTFFGCMNDLKTLCNWPSHVWWHIVFYRLGLSDPACQITLETAHYFHLCFTAVIVRFHSTAVKSAWVCLEWNWKLMASHFRSHELIVVLGNFEVTDTWSEEIQFLLSGKSQIRSDVYMLLIHRHSGREEACLYKTAASSTYIAPAWGFLLLITHRTASRQGSYYYPPAAR